MNFLHSNPKSAQTTGDMRFSIDKLGLNTILIRNRQSITTPAPV